MPLPQCTQLVFTGPQSASDIDLDDSKARGKPSIAVKYNITCVTPEHIVYVATLVCLFMRSQATSYARPGTLTLELATFMGPEEWQLLRAGVRARVAPVVRP